MSKELQRHYIFINPYDLREDIYCNPILNNIQTIHNKHYRKFSGIQSSYWSYNDIAELLRTYDIGLSELYLSINPKYAALLSDIGRFIILYLYGGVYHDLKFLAKHKFVKFFQDHMNVYGIIGEQHPRDKHRVRSGNIISFVAEDPFFRVVLDAIKSRLIIVHKTKLSGSTAMFDIGSGIYIRMFSEYEKRRTDMARKRFDWRYLKYNKSIYKANITKWQDIEEQIVF
jgi:mannosyltransferase OCH1-like enzyme